ncbi:MAG TPA: hypothetical protein ENI23_06675 [bacterium]|nr:hypothetical protein [bacterium]
MALIDGLLSQLGTTRAEVQKKKDEQKKQLAVRPTAVRTPKAPVKAAPVREAPKISIQPTRVPEPLPKKPKIISSITSLAERSKQAQKEREILQRGTAPVVSTFKKQAQRRVVDPLKAFVEKAPEAVKEPPGSETRRRDLRVGFAKSFPATLAGLSEIGQRGLAKVTAPVIEALGGQVPTVERPEILKKITEPTNEDQATGMLMGNITQFFLPLSQLGAAVNQAQKAGKIPATVQKLLRMLRVGATEGIAGGTIAAGQEGEINKDVAFIAALSTAAPIVLPLIGKVLGFAGKTAKKFLRVKGVKVSPEGTKRGVQSILSDGAFKATPQEVKAGRVALDDAAEGVRELNIALKEGATIEEKRNFIKWVRNLFKKADDPVPEIKAFLDETIDVTTASESVVNSYQQRALDIAGGEQKLFKPSFTTALKPIQPGISVGEQRLVGFAKTPVDLIKLPSQTPSTGKGIEGFDTYVLEATKAAENLGIAIQKPKDFFELVTPKGGGDPIGLEIKGLKDGVKVKERIPLEGVKPAPAEVGPKEVELTKAEKLLDIVTLGATKQKKVRNKLAERLLKASDEIVPVEVKQQLREDPSSFHDVVSRKELVSIIEELSEAEMKELIEFGDPNVATVSTALLKRKLRAEGRMDEMFSYIKKGQALSVLSARGLEAQKTWLEFLTPEEKLADIKDRLGETGLTLKESQDKSLVKRFEAVDKTAEAVREIKARAVETTTEKEFKKTVKEYNKAMDKFTDAKRSAEKDITLILPKRIADMAISALQAGFLSIKSLLANPIYNVVFGTLESSSKNIALLGDAAFAKATGKDRTIFAGSLKESFKGAAQGTKGAFVSAIKGPTKKQIRGKVDTYKGLQPIRAMADIATKEFMPIDVKTGEPKLSTSFNRLIEGWTGTLSEPVFRGLVFGDMPFFESSKRNFLVTEAKKAKLVGLERQKFIEFPPERINKEAEKFARKRVFQQDSQFADVINGWIEKVGNVWGVGGVLKFTARANVPFVRTLVNAFVNVVDYVRPEIALGKFLYYSSKGNREAAFMSLGRMTTGIVLSIVASLLVGNEVYKGDEFVSQKQRKLDYATHPPGTINIKGLIRLLSGGDGSYQEGDDIFVSDQRMGALGGVLQGQDSIKNAKEARAKGFDERGIEFEEDTLSRVGMYLGSFGSLGSFALEETFVGEAANVLNIIKESDSAQGRSKFNKWLVKMWQATTSTAMPNSVAAFSKAATLDLKDPDFALKFSPLTGEEKMKIADNIFRERIFQGETLPDTVDLYGQPVARAPGGTNPFIAAIDPIGFKTVGEDAVIKQMYDLFVETGDSGVIPAIPGESFSVGGEKHLLNTAEKYLEYYATIGGEQKKMIEQLINSEYFDDLPAESKADIWIDIHKEGKERGQAIYLGQTPGGSSTLDLYQYANLTPSTSQKAYGAYMLETGQTINNDGNAPLDKYRDYVEAARLLEHGITQDEYVASTIDVFKTKGYNEKTVETKLKDMKKEGKVDNTDVREITNSLFGKTEKTDTSEVDRLIELIDGGGLTGDEITTAISKFEATNNYAADDIEALKIHYQL